MITKLYNESVSVEFTAGKAVRYKVNGEPKPSVTSITGMMAKPALVFWSAGRAVDYIVDAINTGQEITQTILDEARSAHTRESKEAADLGTEVHEWAEQYIKAVIDGKGVEAVTLPEDEKVMNGVLAFLRWKDEHNVSFISSERIIYSKEHDYTGRMDAEAIVDGKKCLIDFKTSKPRKEGGVYSEWRYQTAAYQKAAEEEGTVYEGSRMIAQFNKEDGTFATHILDGLEEDFNAFLGLLAVKKREQML